MCPFCVRAGSLASSLHLRRCPGDGCRSPSLRGPAIDGARIRPACWQWNPTMASVTASLSSSARAVASSSRARPSTPAPGRPGLPSSGEKPTLGEGGVDDRTSNVTPILHVAFARDDDVRGDPQSVEHGPDADRFLDWVLDLRLYDQDVEIASRSRAAASVGSEQEHPRSRRRPRDSPANLCDCALVDHRSDGSAESRWHRRHMPVPSTGSRIAPGRFRFLAAQAEAADQLRVTSLSRPVRASRLSPGHARKLRERGSAGFAYPSLFRATTSRYS